MASRGETDGTAPDAGVVVGVDGGRRSTSTLARRVVAAAAAPVDPHLAERVAGAGQWRREYVPCLAALTEGELQQPDAAAEVPVRGLSALHEAMVWRHGGEDRPLRELGDVPARARLHSLVPKGEGRPERELTVPYRGQQLAGAALDRQLDVWLAHGIVEPDVATAVRKVAEHPDQLALPGHTVVVLGAGSEMGPMAPLMRWGATVAAVDLPSPARWNRVLQTVEAGAGHALIAASGAPDGAAAADVAGVDVRVDAPALIDWLVGLDGPIVLGDYVYAPGSAYLQVAAAVDAVFEAVRQRRSDQPGTAVLISPTDALPSPPDAVSAAGARGGGTLAARLARTASAGRAFRPGYDGPTATLEGRSGWAVADCLVPQQGPNYALAKRVHQWRARRWSHEGHVVSAHVAPPTRTRSATQNRLIAAAYAGAHTFGIEVFEPETAQTLMAALLVHDLGLGAEPDGGLAALGRTAAHGGLFRLPWLLRSVLPLAAVRGLPATLRR